MRRAIILVTLTLLLFAVAGVTVATENTSSQRAGDQTEFTAPESTEPAEATAPETTIPETTVREDVEEPDERTVEKTVVPEEPQRPGEEDPGAVNHGGVGNGTGMSGEPAARPGGPEHPQGGKQSRVVRETGGPAPGGPPARPDGVGEVGEERAGGNQGKVTLCHKNKVTISVGAPAKPAHLRHGDTVGPC